MVGRVPQKIELVGRLAENPWFSVLLQSVQLSDGSVSDYYTIDFPRPTIGIVPRRGDEILLIRQYRFIVGEYVWAIPSGGVQEGETLEEAAARELFEETGHRSKSLNHLLWYYPSYGCSNQRFELFVADNLFPISGSFDRHEVIDLRWFDRSEVIEMMLQNRIVDGLSLTPLALMFLAETIEKRRTT